MAPRIPPLPPAPDEVLGPTGPRLGAYAGSLGRIDLSGLAPEGLLASVRHAARLKRWQKVLLAGPDQLVSASILDAGAVAGAALLVTDRRTGAVLAGQSVTGLPGLSARVGERPGAGLRASFAGPGLSLSLERRSDRFQLEATLGEGLALEALLDTRGAPEPFALVAPLPEGGVRALQLAGPLAADGTLTLAGVRHPLAGGLAVLDYGAGIFPRESAWRRVTAAGRLADGRPLALHLADGLAGLEPGDGGEGVVLLGAGPERLPAVPLTGEPRPGGPAWRLASADGSVALDFQPAAVQEEARELVLVTVAVTRLAGTLSGQVTTPGGGRLVLDRVPAVAELLAARW